MTREEAIKVLQRMKYPYKCNKRKMIISNVDRDNEALEMAISALEQQSCEDAVSREAVIAWFCNQRCGCGCVDRKSCPILVGIRELPSVTVRQKKCEECKNNRTSICGNCNDYDEWEQGFRIDTTLTDFLEERVRFAKAEINNAIESTFCTKDEAVGLGIALNVIDKYFTI